MERDRRVAVVADTGSSLRPDSAEAKEWGVTVVPLEIKFWENGQFIPYADSDISNEDFYRRMMAAGRKLPQTSGIITGRLTETFRKLREKYESVISINITSKESGVWNSAVLAKNIVIEEPGPKTEFEVVDTHLVSLAALFSVETAALAAKKGASLKSVKEEAEEVAKNSQIYVCLETFDNLRYGGRGSQILEASAAITLSLFPVMGFSKEGKLKRFATTRPKSENARQKMLEMLGDEGNLVRLAVVHTNAPGLAVRMREELIKRKIFSGIIPIYEAGPVLAVHAGQGAVGFAFQKA
jgi:DegV family protein with EDD domain